MTIIANLQTARRLRQSALELKEIHADLVAHEIEGMRVGAGREILAALRAVISSLVDGIALAEKPGTPEDIDAFLAWYRGFPDLIARYRAAGQAELQNIRSEGGDHVH